MPQLHHQVALVLSLFGSLYLCSHILSGMKIKSSTNHFWWSPWRLNPFSVLWKCPYSQGLKIWEAYIREKVSGVPWEQISQITLTTGNRCNKYHALIDVSYVWSSQWYSDGILVKYHQKDSPSSLNIYTLSIYKHCCVTYKATEHCLWYLLKVKQDKYILFCLTKCHAGYRTIDLLCNAELYGKRQMQFVQAATIQLYQATKA